MNVEDIELGCLGLEKEGWFDPWSLLFLMKRYALEKNTLYIHAEVIDFLFRENVDIHMEGVEGNYQCLDAAVVSNILKFSVQILNRNI